MTDSDRVILIECNIDDMTGEELGFLQESLLEQGALDAWFAPIQMKKGRPGIQVSVLSREEDGVHMRTYLLAHSSTLGVRWRKMERQIAQRRMATVDTPLGVVRCKLKILCGRVVSAKPEYEDCASIARSHEIPLRAVQALASRAADELIAKGMDT